MQQQVIELANGRRIGDGAPCFIIAEAGSNWRAGAPKRDLAMGCALIDAAAAAACDAVKFQTYRADTVYVKDAGESDYLAESGIKESINDIFVDLEMPYEMLEKLAAHARKRGILFMSTPFSVRDADAVDPHVLIHKIASYEISHTVLQAHVARMGKPIVFSTGAASYEDIDFAISHLRANGATQLAMLQCTAKYPAGLEDLNLRVIPELAKRYAIPVGLSDHSREATVAPAAAVALGAKVLEKHFTLKRELPGPDHPFAIEPNELKAMVEQVRATERALGSASKEVVAAERELFAFARRGVQAVKKIAKGDVVRLGENVDILRPGKQALGAHPRFLTQLEGKRARRDLPMGCGVKPEDVE